VPSVGDAHVYVVPAGIVPVGVYENARSEHAEPVCELIVATGLIVTVTVNGAPVVHVLPLFTDVGVTLYVAVAATDNVLLLNNVPFSCACPVPDAPPLTPDCIVGIDHAYVVFAGIVPVGV
jgi:hypothetical protein